MVRSTAGGIHGKFSEKSEEVQVVMIARSLKKEDKLFLPLSKSIRFEAATERSTMDLNQFTLPAIDVSRLVEFYVPRASLSLSVLGVSTLSRKI